MEANTEKTQIRPDTSKMVKTKGGSFHKDDTIGNALEGVNVPGVMSIAADLGVDVGKYSHLNAGQQRMTVGNILRRLVQEEQEAIAKNEAAAAEAEAKGEEYAHTAVKPVLSVIREKAQAIRDAAAAEKQRIADEKAAAKAAAAAEKQRLADEKKAAQAPQSAQDAGENGDSQDEGATTLESDETGEDLEGLED